MSNYINPNLSQVAAMPASQDKQSGSASWFQAMADAWGKTLDAQADVITAKSDAISGGNDSPSAITQLTTESLKMSFLSNSSHTSISTVGEALDTMARKQ